MTPPARRHTRIRIAALTASLAVTVLSVLAAANVTAGAQNGPRDGAAAWSASLTPDGDDTNVRAAAGTLRLDRDTIGPASIRTRQPEGMLVTPAHRLAQPSDEVAAELLADRPAGSAVAVAVRGTRQDGSWTEWVPASTTAPAMLDALVTAVQSRIALRGGDGGASPVVRSVQLTARAGMRTLAANPRSLGTYRVFATREGLVGGITANGHVIRERDHFVALPSSRGLSPRGSGDYTVKICSDAGRCEWAPVWDVGPWNTTDDYWNHPTARQSWPDLPQGMPEAQAAHDNGYNGGQDQFGRPVANPAGIDLADGTFWDGLGLRNNSWVTVTYLWTVPDQLAIVRIPILHVHSGPGEQYPTVGLAVERAKLIVECTTGGQVVTGSQGATSRWLRIGPNHFVSAAQVSSPAPGKRC